MGLISKIEDKLHKDKGESDSSKLQKSSYDDESSSHLRHPVSSGTTGGTQGYDSSTTGTGGLTGSHKTTDVGRDGYGGTTGGYDSRDTAGGYGSSTRDPRDTATGGYGSSIRSDPRDHISSGGIGGGPREPYDPYSKGQNTAATAATGYPGTNTRGADYDHGSRSYANEPNVPRSHDGGILNPGSHPSSRNPDAIPTAGGQRVGGSDINDPYSSNTSSRRDDPYSSSTHNSSGHPIRDAALGGGAGATAGYGGAEPGLGSGTHAGGLSGSNVPGGSSGPDPRKMVSRFMSVICCTY